LVSGYQIGSILGGQILTSTPEEAKFRKTANEIGSDEESYVNAVKNVSITSMKNITAAAEVLQVLWKLQL